MAWLLNRTSLRHRDYELSQDREVVATLTIDRWAIGQASATVGHRELFLRRQGVLLRGVTVTESGLTVAEVERRGLSNDGVIAFEGQRFSWRRDNIAGTKWRMIDAAEHLSLRFRSRAMRRQGRVEVEASGATRPAPLLLPLLGCYLAIIADDDQGGG